MEERIFMKPGKDNNEDRMNFVKFWVEYVKSHNDKEWSKQQNIIINSQIINSQRFYKKLAETEEGREKIKEIIKSKSFQNHQFNPQNL